MIKIALATAHALGLKKTKIEKRCLPTTAHFMTTGRCLYDCSFCTQARSSKKKDQYLSRVIWPEFEEDRIREVLKNTLEKKFKRICLQVTQSPDYLVNTINFIEYIKGICSLPLSVSIRPKNLEEVKLLFGKGIDRMGLALDVVDKDDYQKVKKGNFGRFYQFLTEANRLFPGRITTHIIIGFSETEKQAITLIKKLHDEGITVALFALTPVTETAASLNQPPEIGKYRRIQLARYLITNNLKYKFAFNKEGELTGIGFGKNYLLKKLQKTPVFQTCGCLGCNRPFYNERPGKKPYNYPYRMSNVEFKEAIEDLNLVY